VSKSSELFSSIKPPHGAFFGAKIDFKKVAKKA